ncbi:aspartate aminotransferase family protein [Bacillus sp. M6-12]|uniref:aspartate aminotransferase family protein n=1 Tax=Bacillus sp. M6-12 TaxID=2054166 RepID=UPI000C7827FA|nr:aspartate aminotransferase family protein [Bacillus sp. M6-12]PLS16241.1 aspartate aminotransferase family protein [Bacillus sp. M6-12]
MNVSYLIKPMLNAAYPVISHGKGVFLFDREGKDYLDASSGAVTANIGHGVQEVVAAMAEQANKVSFVYRSQFTSEAAEKLAEKIAKMTDGRLKYSFFVNSGSEATETAMKIAIQFWQEKGRPSKHRIISRWRSYHGITIGALSMSGHTARRARFTPLLEDFPAIDPPYCYRCPFNSTYPSCGLACANQLQTAIKRIGAEQIAAFIAEPVIGAAGAAIAPPEGYFEKIKDICEDNDILFIADEVMTGFGRTGKILACDHYQVVPDIVAFGKGMSGGYTPIAAAVVSEKVLNPILIGSKLIMSGHTFSANPQSCAVSLAVLNYVDENRIAEKAEETGRYLCNLLKKLAQGFQLIGDLRGKGLLLGLEFVRRKDTKEPFAVSAGVTTLIIELAAKNGLLLYPSAAGEEGAGGDAVIIAPPLTITKRECEELVRRLRKTLEEAETIIQAAYMNEE